LQTFNIQFQNQNQLLNFIQENSLQSAKNLLIQICSGLTDEKKVLSIGSFLKEQLPQADLIGTTTAGEILNSKMYDETILISFTIFHSTTIKSKLYNLEHEVDLKTISDELIQKNTKALIVFSDGLKSNAEELLAKLTAINPEIIIAGGRAADLIQFKKTFVFNHNEVTENGFVIASLSGDDLIVNSDYMLNWNQIGKEMVVTKADGNIVYEIDNITIRDLYEKYLGSEISDNLPSAGTEFPLITIRNGIKVARSPIAILEDGGFLFGGNLNVGEKVKFAYGNLTDIKNSIYNNSVKFSKLPIESIFIYSCSGRKTLMGKELETEFQMLNSLAPTAGFFTYGEYFHSAKVNEVLNITTTFLALSENSKSKNRELLPDQHYEDNRILQALTHLTNVTTKEIEYKNHELFRLNDILSKTVLYSTSDLDGNITAISQAYLDFLNLSYKDVIGKNHNIFKHPDTPDSFYVKMWAALEKNQRFVDDIKNKRKDGTDYWMRITIDPIFDENGNKIGYSSYREDVTDKKLLEYISAHDILTGLYNRNEFLNRIKAKLKSAHRYNENFGFVLLDIDHFKKVNDTYGHKVGDDVLKKISTCLSDNIRDDDFLARWGGEEFVIIAKYANVDNLILLIQKLQIAISKISFDPVPAITLSFGLTVHEENDTKDSLLIRADKALYTAKENGRDRYEVA
jgi:diguanylate cyclase (GGDEF)-like protein/PAS domain S-box-containing protein